MVSTLGYDWVPIVDTVEHYWVPMVGTSGYCWVLLGTGMETKIIMDIVLWFIS